MRYPIESLRRRACLSLAALFLTVCWSPPLRAEAPTKAAPVYSMSPVGWVRKAGGKTWIEIEPKYQEARPGPEHQMTCKPKT